jgi:hypothetical protein
MVDSPSSPVSRSFPKIAILIGAIAIFCVLISCCFLFLAGSPDSEKLGKTDYKESVAGNSIKTEKWGEIQKNQLLVMLLDSSSREDANKIASQVKGKIVGEIEFINLFQIETTIENEAKLEETIALLEKNPQIEAVGPDVVLTLKQIKAEPCKILDDMYTVGDNSKHYEMIGMQRAWDMINASGVKLNKVHVGVTDSGLNNTSEELKGKIKISAMSNDDVNNTPDVDSRGNWNTGGYNHGTAVTNMIAGDWGNGGTRGVAGGLKEFLTVTVSNLTAGGSSYKETSKDDEDLSQIESGGKTYTVKTFAKMIDQIKNGAEVINYSWGSQYPNASNAFRNKITRKFLEKVHKKYPKVVFVAAAGNEALTHNGVLDGTNYDFGGTPAPNLITVGSVDKEGKRSEFSNKVTKDGEITLVAVGTDVPAVIDKVTGEAVPISGTSFATPQVSGTIAILKSINPDLTAEQIKKILVETATTQIANPAISERIKDVEPEAGGPLLQLDKAVLKVLLEHPEYKDKDFTEQTLAEKLQKISRVEIYADRKQEDELSFDIFAKIDELRQDGTNVVADTNGPGLLSGRSQYLTKPETVKWSFSFLNQGESATIKVTRQDSGACATLFLKTEPEATPTPTPQPTNTPAPTQKPQPTKYVAPTSKPAPTRAPTAIPTQKPLPTSTPAPTPKHVGQPYQVISDCNLCWNAGMSCNCGTYQCRCCPNNDDNCNAFDL